MAHSASRALAFGLALVGLRAEQCQLALDPVGSQAGRPALSGVSCTVRRHDPHSDDQVLHHSRVEDAFVLGDAECYDLQVDGPAEPSGDHSWTLGGGHLVASGARSVFCLDSCEVISEEAQRHRGLQDAGQGSSYGSSYGSSAYYGGSTSTYYGSGYYSSTYYGSGYYGSGYYGKARTAF